jgi:hypothetical protein
MLLTFITCNFHLHPGGLVKKILTGEFRILFASVSESSGSKKLFSVHLLMTVTVNSYFTQLQHFLLTIRKPHGYNYYISFLSYMYVEGPKGAYIDKKEYQIFLIYK